LTSPLAAVKVSAMARSLHISMPLAGFVRTDDVAGFPCGIGIGVCQGVES
jgi:hypothetical protein